MDCFGSREEIGVENGRDRVSSENGDPDPEAVEARAGRVATQGRAPARRVTRISSRDLREAHRREQSLVDLSASRKSIATTMREIDDYMNWFEATKSRGPSGAFTDYLKAAELAPQPEERR